MLCANKMVAKLSTISKPTRKQNDAIKLYRNQVNPNEIKSKQQREMTKNTNARNELLHNLVTASPKVYFNRLASMKNNELAFQFV